MARQPFGPDTLLVPAYRAKGVGMDDPGLDAWKREHPDWFVAGTWTAPRVAQRARPPQPPPAGADDGLDTTEATTRRAAAGIPSLDPATLSLADFERLAATSRTGDAAEDPDGSAR